MKNIGIWILGIVIGMVFVKGEYIAAAFGVIATLFFMTNHFDDDQEEVTDE